MGDHRRADARIVVDQQQRGDLARALGDIQPLQPLIQIARDGHVDGADVEAQRVLEHIDIDVLGTVGGLAMGFAGGLVMEFPFDWTKALPQRHAFRMPQQAVPLLSYVNVVTL